MADVRAPVVGRPLAAALLQDGEEGIAGVITNVGADANTTGVVVGFYAGAFGDAMAGVVTYEVCRGDAVEASPYTFTGNKGLVLATYIMPYPDNAHAYKPLMLGIDVGPPFSGTYLLWVTMDGADAPVQIASVGNFALVF